MKKSGGTIWIVWSVIFAVVAISAVFCCLVMYVYFTRIAPAQAQAKRTEGASESGTTDKEPENADVLSGASDDERGYFFTEEELREYLASRESEVAENAAQSARAELLSKIKQMMQDEGSTVKMLRSLFPEELVVFSNATYFFIPIDDTLKKAAYDTQYFKVDEASGVFSYDDGAGLIARKGIDVSRFQGKIDWAKVKNSGVEFALIRLGLRGYTEGAVVIDETYEYNIDEAAAQDIHTGVYFFSQAKNVEEMDEEIDFIMENLAGHEMDGPIVVDIEDVNNGKGRTGNLTVSDRTALTKHFCERITELGYRPMIYGNLKSFTLMLDMKELEDYPKWFAFYDLPVYFPYDYDILQYSESGGVDGITGNVDLNLAFRVWYD